MTLYVLYTIIVTKGGVNMCNIVNPYTPGAGVFPSYLAGRDELLDNTEKIITTMIAGYPVQPIVYYGLRGVGKTVILNALEERFEQNLDNLYTEFLETKENGSLLKDIISISNKFINKLSISATASHTLDQLKTFVKSIIVSYNFEGEISVKLGDNTLSNNITIDLTDLFLNMGRIAADNNIGICFFIDEIQFAKKAELESLFTAIHRVIQKRLPITIIGAGLPKILKTFGDVKSYSERMFKFVPVDTLEKQQAFDAIQKPAIDLGITYTQDALNEIYNVTNGSPYFIQQVCKVAWDNLTGSKINKELVVKIVPEAFKELDLGFFKVRYDRCSKAEVSFLCSMVKCDKLPCTIANVAQIMDKTVKQISPIRGSLINKGIIYATQHGEIDFTVPKFSDFLKRNAPELFL